MRFSRKGRFSQLTYGVVAQHKLKAEGDDSSVGTEVLISGVDPRSRPAEIQETIKQQLGEDFAVQQVRTHYYIDSLQPLGTYSVKFADRQYETAKQQVIRLCSEELAGRLQLPIQSDIGWPAPDEERVVGRPHVSPDSGPMQLDARLHRGQIVSPSFQGCTAAAALHVTRSAVSQLALQHLQSEDEGGTIDEAETARLAKLLKSFEVLPLTVSKPPNMVDSNGPEQQSASIITVYFAPAEGLEWLASTYPPDRPLTLTAVGTGHSFQAGFYSFQTQPRASQDWELRFSAAAIINSLRESDPSPGQLKDLEPSQIERTGIMITFADFCLRKGITASLHGADPRECLAFIPPNSLVLKFASNEDKLSFLMSFRGGVPYFATARGATAQLDLLRLSPSDRDALGDIVGQPRRRPTQGAPGDEQPAIRRATGQGARSRQTQRVRRAASSISQLAIRDE